MIPVQDLFDEFYPYLPGCTLDYFKQTAVHVARDFCTTTLSYRADLDPVPTVVEQALYELEPSEAMAEVVKITRLSVNGLLLWDERRGEKWLHGDSPKYEHAPFDLDSTLQTITLHHDEIPDTSQADGLTGQAAYRPTQNASSLPDIFGEFDTKEALRCGVLARMLSMPSRPWSNPQEGMYYQAQYESKVSLLANRSAQGQTRTPLRVRKWG